MEATHAGQNVYQQNRCLLMYLIEPLDFPEGEGAGQINSLSSQRGFLRIKPDRVIEP